MVWRVSGGGVCSGINWCVKFDRKIVTYINSRGKGYKEDFVFEELEAAI